MIQSKKFKSKKYAVVGLGRSGLTTLKCLEKSGAKTYAWDDSGDGSTHPLTSMNDIPWSQLEALILSPGIPLSHPKPHPTVLKAKEHNVPIFGDIDLLMQAQPKATYIGITGTNGKSTASSLIHHILRHAGFKTEIGGNIGIPCLALNSLEKEGIYILELSSYQLDLLHEKCLDFSILLNITPDHIDRHGSLENYCLSKKRIFDQQREGGTKIITGSDKYSQEIAKSSPGAINTPHHKKLSVRNGKIFASDKEICNFSRNFSLQGEHNEQNVMAAVCIAAHFQIDNCTLEEALLSFSSLPHRQEKVGEYKHIDFVNDSKATNADATAGALNRFKNIFWIVGGRAKDGGIHALATYFKNINHAFLIGESTPQFKDDLQGKIPFTESFDLENAVSQAFKNALTSKEPVTILLSPSCSSFDQFKNFEVRGEAFRKTVLTIIKRQEEIV